MAVLTSVNPTLLDLAKMMGPDGKIASSFVELAATTEEILEDMVVLPGNMPAGNQTTVLTNLATPTWRKINGGVQPTKATHIQVTETCGSLTDYAEVDAKAAEIVGADEYRAKMWRAKWLGFAKEMSSTLFYGDEAVSKEEFTGLATRYDATTMSQNLENEDNMIDGGGVAGQTDCQSIWIVGWGEHSCHGFYPKNTKAGFKHKPKGEVTAENFDGANGRAEIFRDYFEWDMGLAIPDWRYVVRIHSIDLSTLTKDAATGPDLYDLVSQGLERMKDLNTVKPRIYTSRIMRSWLRRQAKFAVKSSTLQMGEVAGKSVIEIDGVPVRRCDALVNETSLN